MIKNYFLIAFRSILKNGVFVSINVAGMGIAIACCIVAYFAYDYDNTFDLNHKNGEQIYRVSSVRQFENNLTHFSHTPLPLGHVIQKTFPDVNKSTRYVHSNSNFKREGDIFPSNLTYVDPDFFRMFTFDFISGNPLDLKDKTSVFISETMAIRLFKNVEDALGKNIAQIYGDQLKELKIGGVFREPRMNSSFFRPSGSSAYMNFENYTDEFPSIRQDDWSKECTLFVQINENDRVNKVNQQLQNYRENNNKVREDFFIKEFTLDQLTTMARNDRAAQIAVSTWVAPPFSAIIGSAIMGILILLIACFNLTNTAIAISSGRLREIGIRKVMGSMRMQLIVQFMGETIFICFLALILGLGLSDLFVSGWNSMWSYMQLAPHYLDKPAFLFFFDWHIDTHRYFGRKLSSLLHQQVSTDQYPEGQA